MATEPTETYGGQLDAIEEGFSPPCRVVTSLREIARDSFGPGWREVSLDVSSHLKAFPELYPFQLLREAGLLPAVRK